MHYYALAIGILWILFWVYWIVSAYGSKKSIRPTNVRSFLAARLLFIGVAAVLALLYNRLPHLLGTNVLGQGYIVRLLAFLLFMCGILLAIWARIYLGKNWGFPMTERADPELITSGPYRLIRHPIYTGLLCMALASAVDVNLYWLIVFGTFMFYFIYSAVVEERDMTRQFPKAYPKYKQTSKMLIPYIF